MLLALAFPGAQSVPIDASPSAMVLAFACGLSLLTGVLFGVAPAWMASKAEPADALRSGARSTAGGATLLQRGLVVVQAALSLVLLVGAGLFAQSLNKLRAHRPEAGCEEPVYRAHQSADGGLSRRRNLAMLYRTIEERFHALPGVVKVGISSLYADGGQQQRVERADAGQAGSAT